jgi:phosphoglycolate phosphatase
MTELRHSSTHLVVFDLDGTLVDSRRDIADSANDTLVAYGAGPLSEEAIGRMVGDGAPVLVARAFAAAGAEKPADALDRFLTIYDERLLDHTKPYPGIPNVLSELSTRARLAVLTNKPVEPTRRILDGLDLTRYFGPNWVIAGDGPFARKPDPAGLQHLISSAGTSAGATVLVGDSAIDWQTGLRANVKVCVARYGFGGDGFVESLPTDAWAIDSPGELLDHL